MQTQEEFISRAGEEEEEEEDDGKLPGSQQLA